jgi:hypothetical protein
MMIFKIEKASASKEVLVFEDVVCCACCPRGVVTVASSTKDIIITSLTARGGNSTIISVMINYGRVATLIVITSRIS